MQLAVASSSEYRYIDVTFGVSLDVVEQGREVGRSIHQRIVQRLIVNKLADRSLAAVDLVQRRIELVESSGHLGNGGREFRLA